MHARGRTTLLVAWVGMNGIACTDGEARGSTSACYAIADEPADASAQQLDVVHTGVRPVAAGEEGTPPETWSDCAQGLAQAAELVDGADAHFWLAVDAVLGGRDLLPDGILALLDGDEVEVHQWRGWNNGDSVFVSNGEQPILALQNHGPLDGDQGALQVADNGPDALGSLYGCGVVTSHSLRFTDDDGSQGAGNGATVQLIVGGVEFLATNLFSVEYGASHCTDGPWPANQATWVAYDNSL